MIGRRGRVFILLYVMFLAVLFLMCSTDLIIREPEKEVYQIAVIIEDVRDDNYASFRKGMDQAAMEFNADVRFITLYEKLDAGQQMEFMSREQQDGADALIVVPADEEQVAAALAKKQITIPVVILGAGLTGEGVAGAVVTDYKNMGRQLAEKIGEDVPEGCSAVILADSERQSIMSRMFLEGVFLTLEEQGRPWKKTEAGDHGQGIHDAIEALESQEDDSWVIVTENPEILTMTAGILAEYPGIQSERGEESEYIASGREGLKGLYGRGSTLSILNYLDRGQITGICVTDGFSEGYLSVKMAVEALEGRGSGNPVVMDSFYIKKENLRQPEYEKLLFPVE